MFLQIWFKFQRGLLKPCCVVFTVYLKTQKSEQGSSLHRSWLATTLRSWYNVPSNRTSTQAWYCVIHAWRHCDVIRAHYYSTQYTEQSGAARRLLELYDTSRLPWPPNIYNTAISAGRSLCFPHNYAGESNACRTVLQHCSTSVYSGYYKSEVEGVKERGIHRKLYNYRLCC